MRTVNKIRERDMDPSFLLSLMSNDKTINVKELLSEYVRKDDTISVTMLPTDYVQSVDNRFGELQTEINNADKIYRKISVPIEKTDLSQDLQKILDGLFYFLAKVKMKDENNPVITYDDEGDRIVIIYDEDGNEWHLVVPAFPDEDEMSAIDKLSIQAQLSQLQSKVNTLENENSTLTRRLNNLLSSGGNLGGGGTFVNPDNIDLEHIDEGTIASLISLLGAQASKISALETIVSAITGIDITAGPEATVEMYNPSDTGTLSQLEARVSTNEASITTLNSKINSLNIDNLSGDISQKLAKIDTLETTVSSLQKDKMNAPYLDINGYLYYNADNGQVVKSRPPVSVMFICEDTEEVIEAQSNKEKFILNITTGEGYSYNDTKKAYETIQVVGNTDYDNLLIMDQIAEQIRYFILNGTIIRLGNANTGAEAINSANIFVRKIQIAAGQKQKVARLNNLKKFPPLVLIYDLETDSRTHGLYINGEGVITVAHEDDGFTLYNDSEYKLDIMVMAGD